MYFSDAGIALGKKYSSPGIPIFLYKIKIPNLAMWTHYIFAFSAMIEFAFVKLKGHAMSPFKSLRHYFISANDNYALADKFWKPLPQYFYKADLHAITI